MDAQYTLSTFTPGEAEAITGLTTTMQRDWRRPERGYLAKGDGHARFDCFDLAKMLTMKVLADRGVGPQQSKEVAEWCAAGICFHALAWKDSYEGDHERTHDWQPEAMRPKREMDPETYAITAAAALKHGFTFPPIEDFDAGWSEKADWLRKQVLRLKGYPRVIPAPYLLWLADGTHMFTAGVDEFLGSMASSNESLHGPLILLDLSALATALATRAGRPLVHVEFSTDPATGEIEPPIQYGTPVPLEVSE